MQINISSLEGIGTISVNKFNVSYLISALSSKQLLISTYVL